MESAVQYWTAVQRWWQVILSVLFVLIAPLAVVRWWTSGESLLDPSSIMFTVVLVSALISLPTTLWSSTRLRVNAWGFELVGLWVGRRRYVGWGELEFITLETDYAGEETVLVLGRLYPAPGRSPRGASVEPEVIRVTGIRTGSARWAAFQQALTEHGQGVWRPADDEP